MDWRLVLTTFATVFLAELGDKTQLATMALAADSRSRLAVFVGAAGALVLAAALGVLLGDVVARFVDPLWVQRAAAALFIVLGVWLAWSSVSSGNATDVSADGTSSVGEAD